MSIKQIYTTFTPVIGGISKGKKVKVVHTQTFGRMTAFVSVKYYTHIYHTCPATGRVIVVSKITRTDCYTIVI